MQSTMRPIIAGRVAMVVMVSPFGWVGLVAAPAAI
jgi:hypothetical protein